MSACASFEGAVACERECPVGSLDRHPSTTSTVRCVASYVWPLAVWLLSLSHRCLVARSRLHSASRGELTARRTSERAATRHRHTSEDQTPTGQGREQTRRGSYRCGRPSRIASSSLRFSAREPAVASRKGLVPMWLWEAQREWRNSGRIRGGAGARSEHVLTPVRLLLSSSCLFSLPCLPALLTGGRTVMSADKPSSSPKETLSPAPPGAVHTMNKINKNSWVRHVTPCSIDW
jgi:hypothetical protein